MRFSERKYENSFSKTLEIHGLGTRLNEPNIYAIFLAAFIELLTLNPLHLQTK